MAVADKSVMPWLPWYMDGGLAAPTEDGESPGRDSAPPSAEAGKPSGRSGPEPQGESSDTTDASATIASSDDRWRRLADRSLKLWHRTRPLRRWIVEFWRRLVRTLQETTPISAAEPAAPPGPVTESVDTPVAIRVSGHGRRFNFHIHARCVWSSENLRREVLLSYAHHYMPDAVRRLTHLAAEHAVNFTAHRAPELEAELQRALSNRGPWSYQRGDTVVTCQAHVWVGVDQRVRNVVLPYWEELVKLDCEVDLEQTRASYGDWVRTPRATSADNVADAEAAPTTSENLAGELGPVVAELRATAQRLEDLIRRTPPAGDTT
ncbi:hypothetical protein [Micromonospora inositola]|uniref:Uncharacterized protein n=1 Tax=Micromonospora inositola TaxID=47865 RepID=A0A1C5JAV6_9ACTN|nr:hypothetical protein [Micromonospora inositola]SCG67411.1 hypothetical protein GA0070613_4297 [Micromonospora inositola]